MLLLKLQPKFALTYDRNVTNCLMNSSEFISLVFKAIPHQGFNISELDKLYKVKKEYFWSVIDLEKGVKVVKT